MFNASIKQTQQIIRQIFEEEQKEYGLDSDMYPVTIIQFYKDYIKKYIKQDGSLSKKLKIIRLPQYAAGVHIFDDETNEETIFVFLNQKRSIKKINRKIYQIVFSTYHEIQHSIQTKIDKYSYEAFFQSMDHILSSYSYDDYLTEHDKYSFEIGANLYAATKTKEYIQKNYPYLYEKEKEYIEKEIQKYNFYQNTYDPSDTIERAIHALKEFVKSKNKSQDFDLEKISPILPIFINPDLSFKSINEIISNDKFKQLDKRIVYAFFSSKSFLETINLDKLNEEKLLLVNEALQYTNMLYLEHLKLLSQETNITLIELLKIEKNILKKYNLIYGYIRKHTKHMLNFKRSDKKRKAHIESVSNYLDKTNELTKKELIEDI